MKTKIALLFNAILIWIISGVLMAAFYVQFVERETPCPLCMLQRAAMIGVTIGALLNLLGGIKAAHYALSLLSSLVGAGIALRQITLHICPQFPTFGMPVLGLSLYTWSFIVFVCAILLITLLLFLYVTAEKEEAAKGIALFSFALIGLIVLMNLFSTWAICGLGPCGE